MMAYADGIEELARRYHRLCVADEFAIRDDFGCCQGQIDDGAGRVKQYGPPTGSSIKCSGWWDVPRVPQGQLATVDPVSARARHLDAVIDDRSSQ